MFVRTREVFEDGEALGVDNLDGAILVHARQSQHLTRRIEPNKFYL